MIPHHQEHLVNFKALTNFSGNNPDFEKQLLEALVLDLTGFKSLVFEKPDQHQYDQFRKGFHNIFPSLKMLEIQDLIFVIQEYKKAYDENEETVAVYASKILELLDHVLLVISDYSNQE